MRALLACGLAVYGFAPGAVDARTWQWHLTVQTANGSSVVTQSRVELSQRDVMLAYSAEIQQRDVTIAACRTALIDIASAKAVRQNGRAFLVLQLKPQRVSSCNSGNQPVALAPVADDAAATSAVAAIENACCSPKALLRTTRERHVTVAQASPPSPSPLPSPARSPSPAPTSSPKPPLQLASWVESEGLFAFVRVANRGAQSVTISSGSIENCRNVDVGCGPSRRGITIAPGEVATIATVMAGASTGPGFSYRFEAESGAEHRELAGSSRARPAAVAQPMSAQDVRSAEALAIAALRPGAAAGASPGPTVSAGPAFVDAHLLHRGSSRLGIGQKGEALVRVSLAANGMPQNATVVKITNRQLTAAAIETAVSSTYAPAIRNGRPIAGTYVATFAFDGDDPALSSIPLWKREPLATATAASATAAAPTAAATASASPGPASPKPGPS